MPPKLKVAARYVLDSPKEVAIQSMRTVATHAKLQPAAMVRFARELGFDSYESFRSLYVTWLSSSGATFVARARSLRERQAGRGQDKLLADIYDMEVGCLDRTLGDTNAAAFKAANKTLLAARWIYKREQLSQVVKEGCGGHFRDVIFCGSGSEAVEGALKTALQYFAARGLMRKRRFIGRRRSISITTYHAARFRQIAGPA